MTILSFCFHKLTCSVLTLHQFPLAIQSLPKTEITAYCTNFILTIITSKNLKKGSLIEILYKTSKIIYQKLVQEFPKRHVDRNQAYEYLLQHLYLRYMHDTARSNNHPKQVQPVRIKKTNFAKLQLHLKVCRCGKIHKYVYLLYLHCQFSSWW